MRRVLIALLALLPFATLREPASASIPNIGYPGATTYSGPSRCEKSFTADYGGVGNGSTDNDSAFESFLASTDEFLYVPAGTYYFGFTSSDISNDVTRDVTITGAGEGVTTVVLGPDYPEAYYHWLAIKGACNVTVQGITFTGPAHPTYNSNIETSPWSRVFYLDTVTSSAATTLTLDHCAWSQVNYGVFAYGGATTPTTIAVKNCQGSAWNQNVTVYRADTSGHRLNVYDSSFTRWGENPGGTIHYGHNFYVHDCVGLDVQRCYFNNTADTSGETFAVKYGSGSAEHAPTVAQIVDSQFDVDGVVQLDANRTMLIDGCEFNEPQAYHAFGASGFTITDTRWDGEVIYGPSQGGSLTFTGCTLVGGSWIWDGSTSLTITNGSLTGGVWKFYGSAGASWTTVTMSGGHVYRMQSNTGTHTYSGCTYSGTRFHSWNGSDYTDTSTP